MSETIADILDRAAGKFVVYRDYAIRVSEVAKVTPKLVKLTKHWGPRQISRDQVILVADTREIADLFKQTVDGVEGEFERRRTAADADRNARVKAAREAADAKIAAIVAATLSKEQSR